MHSNQYGQNGREQFNFIVGLFHNNMKLYDVWPGTNRFLPCGCLMGPAKDTIPNLVFYIVAIAVIIPYCIFMLPVIWKISPAIPIILFVAIAIAVLFLNLTQCTDPGIIPRRPFLTQQNQKFIFAPRQGSHDLAFCKTCQIFRPPRASHCSVCDNCVEVFDHHCPFVNNCIGKRNYRFFILFLASMFMAQIIFLVNVIVFSLSKSGSKVNQKTVIIICSVVIGVIAIPILGFLIFHIYLSLTGRTTRQVIKNIKDDKEKAQWCSVDPSHIDFFEEISENQGKRLKQELRKMKEENRNIDGRLIQAEIS